MINTRQLIRLCLLTGLLAFTSAANADDIDIYSGLGSETNMPNIMIVLDNAANSNADMGACTYWDGTSPSGGSKTMGNNQCALANLAKRLSTRADGSALFSMGFTTLTGVDLPLTPVDDNTYTGPNPLTITGTVVSIPGGTSNRWAIIMAVKALSTESGKVGQGAELQETWAYYTGGNGTYSGVNTAKGLLSGTVHTGTSAANGCQKNYVIFLSGVKAGSSHALELGELPPLDAVVRNALASGQITATQAKELDPSYPGYTGAIPNKLEKGYGIEWARLMNNIDVNSASSGMQSIVTYSISTGATAIPPAAITNGMELFIRDVGTYGGGKYFAAGTSGTELENHILKVLNEIQAVNSVFSSSSLPVSVNAQGTFLNQIYMGMFRPDAGAMPRWPGNLKQYQFVIDPTTGALNLADSLGNLALSTAGTGFISPNAISFWSCTNLTTPYTNPYLTASPANLSTNQIALLDTNKQNCVDPTDGFWKNDPSSPNAVAKGFDLPDGERVERGGSAQRIRQVNLSNDYATAPGTSTNPRKLYTWCPSGSGCINSLTDATNRFDTSNTDLVATAFGATLNANIASLTRSDTTVTVVTSTNHGFSSGDSITIANAAPNDYNGTFTITKTGDKQFTYGITVHPPTTATGSYTASVPGAGVSVSSLVRSGNTVTVTTASSHGMSFGDQVILEGANSNDYNGSFSITSAPSLTSFSFTLNERPVTVAGFGSASSVTKQTGAGCPCSTTVAINAWNSATPGIVRVLGSTTVTVNTDTAIGSGGTKYVVGKSVTITGVVDSNGTSIPEYNGSFIITSVSGQSFTFTTTLSPPSPDTGTIIASTSLAKPITNLTRVGNIATATVPLHPYLVGDKITISGTPGTNEAPYTGTYVISSVAGDNFDYTLVTTPLSPAVGVGGVSMTGTRSSGLDAANLSDLISWVRGKDNQGDEQGPGGTTTVRPSIHGDVLHSRPTVINYGAYPVSITATADSGSIRTATASSAEVSSIASFGALPIVTFANGQACPVTVASSTTFTYFASGCGAAGAQSAAVGSKVVVFYGDNGGVFHAVNGNQTSNFNSAKPGEELWGFIPKQFFTKLNRLRTNSPQLNLPSTPPGISPKPIIKDYFIDGATGVYQLIDGLGNTTKAVLYLSMRRGGNFIYALDVTNPETPTILWTVDASSAGMGELGDTWSQPKVARVKGYCGGVACTSSTPQTPVLIFGGGYDTNEDDEPPLANTKGRAIFVLDALTGTKIWSASHTSGTGSCSGTTTLATCTVAGMDYGIPSDITLVDRNLDGFIDRLYAADVGGNIWRVDLQPGGNSTPDYWQVNRLAALGCETGACTIPTATSQRKFFYPPEVIAASSTYNYDAVIAGTGDREHPLISSLATQRYNRIVLVKDTYTGDNAAGMAPVSFGGTNSLFDATSSLWDGSLNGYYITLAAGEKVVNAPLVTAGFAYMGTNQPAPSSATECTSNLGIAKGYRLNPYNGAYNSVEFSGGGLPPSAVSGVVNVVVDGVVKQVPFLIGGGNPDCVGADCKSALGGQKPPIDVSTKRTRTYRYIKNK
ncbi:MAG: PilC/PilY family type IV pilus protein [Gallionellaceae bacterium]|jgi:type IV pilus assembly protein PilY1